MLNVIEVNASEGVEMLASSVTRLGDLLDIGQLFKAFGNT